MQQKLQNTKNLVSDVFNKVYDKYDLMNNIMSLGIHTSWKNKLIYKMKMIQIEGSKNWRVVGIVLDGIDLISIYRRQFASLAKEFNEDIDQVINSWSIDEDSINFEN